MAKSKNKSQSAAKRKTSPAKQKPRSGILPKPDINIVEEKNDDFSQRQNKRKTPLTGYVFTVKHGNESIEFFTHNESAKKIEDYVKKNMKDWELVSVIGVEKPGLFSREIKTI